MPPDLQLTDLPTEILLCIFKLLDTKTLGSLSCCCKRFYELMLIDLIWINHSKSVIVCNQLSETVLRRSIKCLRAREKCRISINWKVGSYDEQCYSTRVKYMPWLVLERDRLWISRGEKLLGFHRHKGYWKKMLRWQNPSVVLDHVSDVWKFVVSDENIISGCLDGSICIWSEDKGILLSKKEKSHGSKADVRCIDSVRDIVVSGSNGKTLKVWKLEDGILGDIPEHNLFLPDSIWSLAIEPHSNTVCCGTNGLLSSSSLKLFDLESGDVRNFDFGILGVAISDIKWLSTETFLTCGFDCIVKLWDKRVESCVLSWIDPFYANGYCLATDKLYSVLCGTAQHGRIQLWDLRSSVSVQSYFCKSIASSPVYSVSFDPCFVFAGLDTSLNVLNFSGALNQRKDYKVTWQRLRGYRT
ncbi:hypothetical protein LSTR_LSTR001239 [Laodelphax striatellus]|uniref:F-box domain-containing protein n=1 Tax=Laodelphax striatellus TaxID=195883 RepID=A0A482XCQ2_LAOST|nr:hypothetical protein LSTR_LSTR001239 [Laodelphax striatellus]